MAIDVYAILAVALWRRRRWARNMVLSFCAAWIGGLPLAVFFDSGAIPQLFLHLAVACPFRDPRPVGVSGAKVECLAPEPYPLMGFSKYKCPTQSETPRRLDDDPRYKYPIRLETTT